MCITSDYHRFVMACRTPEGPARRKRKQRKQKRGYRLAEELKHFFASFEVGRPEAATAGPPIGTSISLSVQDHEVSCTPRTPGRPPDQME